MLVTAKGGPLLEQKGAMHSDAEVMVAIAGSSCQFVNLSLPLLPLRPKEYVSFEDREIYPIGSGTCTGGTLLGRTVFTALTLLIKQYFRQLLRHVLKRLRSGLPPLSRRRIRLVVRQSPSASQFVEQVQLSLLMILG